MSLTGGILCIHELILDDFVINLFCFKMNLSSTSLETIKLEDQSNYRLIEMGKIKDYFNEEMQYQQCLTSRLSKHLTILDYINKILTVFLTVFSGTNIFTHVKNKQLLGLISSIFSLVGSLFYGIITSRNKIKKEKTQQIIALS